MNDLLGRSDKKILERNAEEKVLKVMTLTSGMIAQFGRFVVTLDSTLQEFLSKLGEFREGLPFPNRRRLLSSLDFKYRVCKKFRGGYLSK
jgi:hypothetical protein